MAQKDPAEKAIRDVGSVEVLATRCGDVDVDGALTGSDVILFRLALTGSTALTPEGLARCRTQLVPGACNISDVAILRRTVEGPDLPPGTGTDCTALTP